MGLQHASKKTKMRLQLLRGDAEIFFFFKKKLAKRNSSCIRYVLLHFFLGPGWSEKESENKIKLKKNVPLHCLAKKKKKLC